MSIDRKTILEGLCVYDPRSPHYMDPALFGCAPTPAHDPDCACDPCFRGKDELAVELLALQSRLALADAAVATRDARIAQLEGRLGAAEGLLGRARRLLHEPSMFSREKLDACVERIDAHPTPPPPAMGQIEWAKVHDGDTVIVGGRKITMRVEPFRADPHPAPADAGAVEKDLFAWLDAQVGEGRGFVGLSLTENGGVGCWLPEDGIPDDAESRPVPEGESVQEAIRLRMERHKAHRAGRPA